MDEQMGRAKPCGLLTRHPTTHSISPANSSHLTELAHISLSHYPHIDIAFTVSSVHIDSLQSELITEPAPYLQDTLQHLTIPTQETATHHAIKSADKLSAYLT